MSQKHRILIISSFIDFILILISSNWNLTEAIPAKLVLHTRDKPNQVVINGEDCPFGVTIDDQNEFTCACITGLWAFYDGKCKRPSLIVGGKDNTCFPLNSKMVKATLISSPAGKDLSNTFALFNEDMSLIKGRLISLGMEQNGDISKTVENNSPLSAVTTGVKSWGMKNSQTCLKPEISEGSFYCSFNIASAQENTEFATDCSENFTNIQPLNCSPFLTGPGECIPLPTNSPDGDNSSALGRVFLPASKAMKNYNLVDSLAINDKDDEDFEFGTTVSELRDPECPVMMSQLWNLYTRRAQEILGLRTPDTSTPKTPVYKMLYLVKEIIQKTCPEHYVPDEYFDTAISMLIGIQRRTFNFQDTFSDVATTNRIIAALEKCKLNVTEYPFLQRDNINECTKKVEDGQFTSFGQIFDTNLPEFWMGFDVRGEESETSRNTSSPPDEGTHFEPFIETSWKSFAHAHAACFSHFDAAYNDHHRFTTLMLSVFTNDVMDIWQPIWKTPENTVDAKPYKIFDKYTYSGLLGDVERLSDAVDYCAYFPQLETKYPWPLYRPRPRLTVDSSFNTPGKRRKRDTPVSDKFQCLHDNYVNDCA